MNEQSAYRVRVEVLRGEHVESTHEVWCAAWGVGEETRAGRDDPTQLPSTFLRSAAKPFQLFPVVAAGGCERFALDTVDLALMASSHLGTQDHAVRVRDILRRLGAGEEHLQCGVHRPYFLEESFNGGADTLRDFGPLQNNCSGNHASMLALAQLQGVEIRNYLDLESASQSVVHSVVEAFCGVTPYIAIDNCGAPCYEVPLQNMARAYGYLANPGLVRQLGASHRALLERAGSVEIAEQALERISLAMATQPEWLSGTQTGATRLARELPGELVVKHGAEGVLCVAHRGNGAALALKVMDGNRRAILPALTTLLMAWGWLPTKSRAPLADVLEPDLLGYQGQVVGKLRAVPLVGQVR